MGAKEQGASEITGRWMVIPRTLIFVVHGDDVLLMKRAPHKKVFPNQYNGLGGHIEAYEDPYAGAIREMKEESGLMVEKMSLVATHHVFTGGNNGILLFVFVATSSHRNFVSDDAEGTLHWIPIQDIRNYDLVEDLFLILPKYLLHQGNAPLFAYVSYDDQDQIQIRYSEAE